jgi:two-component system, NtrC family, response regulator AtoC
VSAHETIAADLNLAADSRPNQFIVWGSSPAMQAIRKIVGDTAATDIPVLIVGESGTGKEILSLQIHRMSDRRDEPFVKTRCRSVTTGRLPGQLQNQNGSEAGGGIFRGTIFLDDICDLEPAGQRQILDLMSDGDTLPGEAQTGGRFISSSRRSLEDDLRAGKFTEELYFRLNGVCLRIPALRDRREDIPELVDFFLTKYANLFERTRPKLDEDLNARLAAYPWPGNVRQLENTVKKIVATGDAEVALEDLVDIASDAPRALPRPSSSLKVAARAASRQAERELISRALTRTHWNRKRAAQDLQISYKALLYKLKQLGLEDSEGS